MSIEKRVMENGLTVYGKRKLVTRTIFHKKRPRGRPPNRDASYEESSSVIYSRKGSVFNPYRHP